MQIKKIIDLSHPISERTPTFPGDPNVSVSPWTTFEKDGYCVHSLHIGSHSGTHVDSPYHFFQDGLSIDQIPLKQFLGLGVVFDVRGKKKGTPITLDDIAESIEKLKPGSIAVFMTGWDQYVGHPTYYEHPYLNPEVVDEILLRGVKTVFIDAINIDPPDLSSFYGHRAILGASGVIVENLTNLDKIDFPNPFFIAFPLKLQGVDGSPVRAVAVELEFVVITSLHP